MGSKTTEKKKTLYAFDFDHTVVDRNSDMEVTKLLSDPALPPQIKSVYDGSNFTEFMNAVFQYLLEKNVTLEQIREFSRKLEPTPGMVELLTKIENSKKASESELVIVSDANDLFIKEFLSSLHPPVNPDWVITNKLEIAQEEIQRITLKPYENQMDCSICPKNLCKGSALLQYIRDKNFERIVYVGDGGNDFCPANKLTKRDFLFVRRGYRLEKILENPPNLKQLKAQVLFFDSGVEIIDKLEL